MVCKCRYTRPQEKAFIRPKSDSVTGSGRVLIQSKPILSSTSPVLAYALGKSSTVDLDILKNKEVAINFTSSGSVPKLEAEAKASTAKLVNFVGNAPKVVVMVDELGFGDEEEESSEPSENQK